VAAEYDETALLIGRVLLQRWEGGTFLDKGLAYDRPRLGQCRRSKGGRLSAKAKVIGKEGRFYRGRGNGTI